MPNDAEKPGFAARENFIGARAFFGGDSHMIRGFTLATIGFLSVCSSLLAQASDFETLPPDLLRLGGQTETASALALNRPDLFSVAGGSLLLRGLPVTTFLDGRRYPIFPVPNGLAVSPLGTFPVAFLSTVRVQATGASPAYATDAAGGIVDLRLRQVATGGEVGVFYGGSGGKYGGHDLDAYIVGGVGVPNFEISAGASYQNSSGRGLSGVSFTH